MIAHVALTRRMPRRMDALSYLVPDGLTVKRGDLVIVPFRTASARGVVLSLSEGSVDKLKTLERVEVSGWISDAQLGVYEKVAGRLLQSTATMMHEVFGGQKKVTQAFSGKKPSIRRSEVPHIQAAVEFAKTHDRCFITATDLVQMVAITEAIKKTLPGSHRVFAPLHHDAEMIAGARTRLGALELRKDSDTDVVIRAGAPEHASYDRNPRYDARTILLEQQAALGGKAIFLDVVPRVQDLLTFENVLSLSAELVPVTTIIDLVDEKKKGFSTLLSDALIKAIEGSLAQNKHILLSYNRKGVATGLLCQDCGYAPRCKTCGGAPTVYGETLACHHCGTDAPMLVRCPKCESTKLKERGIGNQQVEKQLRKLFPDADVVRIEKEKKQKASLALIRPTIILVTRHYLDAVYDPFSPPSFGLVADLMGDLGLSDPSYDATEQSLIRLLELRGVAFRTKCPFVVQAFDAAMISKMLGDPLVFIEEERSIREQASFPPYGTIYRLSTRGEMTIQKVKDLLAASLAGLSIREHEEHKKPVLEIYVKPGMEGNLRSALKQLPDDVIIQLL